MLGLVTTNSTVGATDYQPVDSQIQLKASTQYLINMDNIVKMKVYSTDDSDLRYKLNLNEDKSPPLFLRVAETNAAIQTLQDTSANSTMISLDVFINDYKEDCLTFAECALSTSSTTTKYFNINDIVWGEQNAAATKSMLLLVEGGTDIRKIFVDSNLAQIYDLLTTGTTTTTTSSTSTTSS